MVGDVYLCNRLCGVGGVMQCVLLLLSKSLLFLWAIKVHVFSVVSQKTYPSSLGCNATVPFLLEHDLNNHDQRTYEIARGTWDCKCLDRGKHTVSCSATMQTQI